MGHVLPATFEAPWVKGEAALEEARAQEKELEAERQRQSRAALGIPEAAFYASLALQEGRKRSDMRSIPVSHASGKSKSFFFLSPDQQYIAKSFTPGDAAALLRAFPDVDEWGGNGGEGEG